MHPILHHNLYLVKEHYGLFKAANNYDVYDPSTGELILHCREPRLGWVTRLLRFSDWKTMTPFDVEVTTSDGEPVVRVTRGVNLFLSKVHVLDEDDERIGGFRQKLFSIGGAFQVLGAGDEPLCQLQGKWTGFHYKFVHDGQVLAEVHKKWGGVGKELFTTADNYVLQISDAVPPENPLRMLIVAAVFCIDMVLKER